MLDSWNDGDAKSAIIEFIRSVTTPGDSFVAPEERIATFDNDGTLWCEKPHYVQAEFLVRLSRPGDSYDQPTEPSTREPVGREGKRARLARFLDRLPDLVAGVAETTKDMTTTAFEDRVCSFFDTAIHPTLGVPYTQLAYAPMLELIELLKANGFRVYICTGGGRDFIRAVSEQLYGIPRDHVIGSAATLEYRDGDIYRKRRIELPIDDGPGKPVHIWRHTGRKPLFACGNADGDTEMLEISQFPLLIHHDDTEREFAYSESAEEVQAKAVQRGWTTVSMRRDFRRVF